LACIGGVQSTKSFTDVEIKQLVGRIRQSRHVAIEGIMRERNRADENLFPLEYRPANKSFCKH